MSKWAYSRDLEFHFIYFFILFFRGGGRDGERGEKHQLIAVGFLARNPCRCPDQELNQWAWVAGRNSVHWATPASAGISYKCRGAESFRQESALCCHLVGIFGITVDLSRKKFFFFFLLPSCGHLGKNSRKCFSLWLSSVHLLNNTEWNATGKAVLCFHLVFILGITSECKQEFRNR